WESAACWLAGLASATSPFLIDEADRCLDCGITGTRGDEGGEARIHGAGDGWVARSPTDPEQFIQIVLSQSSLVDEATAKHGAHYWFGFQPSEDRTDTGREDAGNDKPS